MGIELEIVGDKPAGYTGRESIAVAGFVAHLGRDIPRGKQGFQFAVEGIEDHHGKIFYAYGAYRYVNLGDKPTQVFRGPSFTFILDELNPQAQVLQGDMLKLGSVVVQIKRLTDPPSAPVREDSSPGAPAPGKVTCHYLNCRRGKCDRAPEVVREASSLASRLRGYTDCHEILRATVDWLADLYGDVGPQNSRQLRLGAPVAVVLRPRLAPSTAPPWENFGMAIEKDITRNGSAIKVVEESAFPADAFDKEVSFRYEGSRGQVAGIGAGILEETSYMEGVPRAGHFILIQFPIGRKPTRDDLCVLNHTASLVSEALDGVHAARVRRRHDLERRSGRESQRLFHDMVDSGIRASRDIAAVRSEIGKDRILVVSRLSRALAEISRLTRMVEMGQQLSAGEIKFQYERVDLVKLCQDALDRLFEDSEALKRKRRWRVIVLSGDSTDLREVPCDRFAVDRILYNLANNAKRAAGNRDDDLPIRCCVYLILDLVERANLPFARIRVADDGPGLERDVLNTIFQGRFSTRHGLHGVGTQLVGDLVRRHYGTIEVASLLGKGTVIGVLLPASPKGTLDLQNPAPWLTPYRNRAIQCPMLVTRRDLNVLPPEDKLLTDWYNGQGRACDDRDSAFG